VNGRSRLKRQVKRFLVEYVRPHLISELYKRTKEQFVVAYERTHPGEIIPVRLVEEFDHQLIENKSIPDKIDDEINLLTEKLLTSCGFPSPLRSVISSLSIGVLVAYPIGLFVVVAIPEVFGIKRLLGIAMYDFVLSVFAFLVVAFLTVRAIYEGSQDD
jgi:hypothetical protein